VRLRRPAGKRVLSVQYPSSPYQATSVKYLKQRTFAGVNFRSVSHQH
jgi:hypothetical protein